MKNQTDGITTTGGSVLKKLEQRWGEILENYKPKMKKSHCWGVLKPLKLSLLKDFDFLPDHLTEEITELLRRLPFEESRKMLAEMHKAEYDWLIENAGSFEDKIFFILTMKNLGFNRHILQKNYNRFKNKAFRKVKNWQDKEDYLTNLLFDLMNTYVLFSSWDDVVDKITEGEFKRIIPTSLYYKFCKWLERQDEIDSIDDDDFPLEIIEPNFENDLVSGLAISDFSEKLPDDDKICLVIMMKSSASEEEKTKRIQNILKVSRRTAHRKKKEIREKLQSFLAQD